MVYVIDDTYTPSYQGHIYDLSQQELAEHDMIEAGPQEDGEYGKHQGLCLR